MRSGGTTVQIRRRLLAALVLAPFTARAQSLARAPLKVGLTKVFLDDQIGFVRAWRRYVEARLERPVDFVQRQAYREIVDPLREGRLEFAWICGYPFVRHRAQLKLVAVPLFEGEPLYRSYLIVPASDSATRTLDGLRGKVFAFSDPDSNSGHLYTRYELHRRNTTPGAFFARTFFTLAHRKVVEAVATGVAQGGAVDGYVWETLARLHPGLTGRTRVVEKSPQFGHPPFVASAATPATTVKAMQAVLLGMVDNAEGATLLRQLNLDGFVRGEPKLFDSIAGMMRAVDRA
jgi:phosphonate transport system substrate-binding protein